MAVNSKRNINVVLLFIGTVAGSLGLFPAFILAFLAAARLARENGDNNIYIFYSGLGALTFGFFMLCTTLFISVLDANITYVYVIGSLYAAAVAGGFCLLGIYRHAARKNRLFQRCLWLIRSEHITDVPRLGEIFGLHHQKMAARIQEMLDQGLLEGAALSQDQTEVLLGRSIWAQQRVECVKCGAVQTVNFGDTLVCDACGGALKAKRVPRVM